MEEKLWWSDFYRAYTDFYGDWYYDLIQEWYELYKKWKRYSNKSFFIDEFLKNKGLANN